MSSLQAQKHRLLESPTSPDKDARYWWDRYVETNSELAAAEGKVWNLVNRVKWLERELDLAQRYPAIRHS